MINSQNKPKFRTKTIIPRVGTNDQSQQTYNQIQYNWYFNYEIRAQ